MPSRRRLLRVTLAGAALTLLAACGGPASRSTDAGWGSTGPATPGAAIGTRVDHALDPALLALPLTDEAGHRVRLDQFKGKVLVVSDSMTLCQETCPLDTATVVETARAVERAGLGDRVVFVSLTVDPQRDTPAQLAAYRAKFKPVPQDWINLTGSRAAVDRWWTALGVWRQKVADDAADPPRNWRTGQQLTYDISHSDEVFFFGIKQHERFVLEGPPHVSSKAEIPSDIYAFMNAKGRHHVTDPSPEAWTEQQALEVIGWLTGQHVKA